MPPRRELCRNFQRGSCQYGDRCKFLHATPQQSKANLFGSGVQQQTSNLFSFSVQNDSHTGGINDFGSKPNQFKPFGNKWIRDSSRNASGASVSQQSNSQSQAVNHKCNDPESCKNIMVEDFENEMPQWKLTCYGHSRNGPCDIVGDIRCEELRGLAYDDAKCGLSLHSIIDREKSLVNSKLLEFQNLVHKPYMVSSDATPIAQRTLEGMLLVFNPLLQLLPPPGGSTRSMAGYWSCLLSEAAAGSTLRDAGTGKDASTSLAAGDGSAGTPNYALVQVSPLQNPSQPFSVFPAITTPLNSSGTSINQFPHQAVQSSFSFGSATPSNNVMNAKNPFSTSSKSSHMANVADSNMKYISNVPNIASNVFGQSTIGFHDNLLKENTDVDYTIWNKTEWKWNVGEIPEDEPPSSCIH